ncbi:TPA: hypothetical protein ENS27_14530 [bacterium]|nr:hypothetical protein [bacterium]
MINAPYEKEFVFHNGKRAKNLLELSLMLENISQNDFEKFVNPSKNDFANWIEYVLQDKDLASSLRSTIILDKTKELINSRVASYSDFASVNTSLNGGNTRSDVLKQENLAHVADMHPINDASSENHKIEHHKIEPLPKPEKHSWWKNKNNTVKNDISQDNSEKKDNPLLRWYKFKRKEFIDNKNIPKKENHSGMHPENLIWVTIYGVLILSIIILILYKFDII